MRGEFVNVYICKFLSYFTIIIYFSIKIGIFQRFFYPTRKYIRFVKVHLKKEQ